MLRAGLLAVPDDVAFDTGTLGACWASHERLLLWITPASTCTIRVSTTSVVAAAGFLLHGLLEKVNVIAFEVCGRCHVLQVVVLEDLATFLHWTRDTVPAIDGNLDADVMFDAGLADGDLS